MKDFVILETMSEGEELVLQRSEISSINSGADSEVSTIRMKNGDEFEVKGSATHLIMYEIGTKNA
jgi:hypothetical protein